MAQLDLRSSHFNLGNTPQVEPFTSQMKIDYQKFQGGAQDSLGDKLNVRASHFEFGTNSLNYNTTFKQHYPHHLSVENARLNDEKKWDLRRNHFVLGHQDGVKQSVTKSTYEQKPIQENIQNEQDLQKAKMRAHHHDFAESKNKIMRTYYNEQYRAYGQGELTQSLTKQEIQNRVVGLRQSHIILGKEVQSFQQQHYQKVPLKSTQQGDYAPKNGEEQQIFKIPPQQSHFALGNQENDFKTVNQEYLGPQQIQKNDTYLDNKHNLRATHFTLGQDGQPYLTEQQGNFRNHSSQPINQRSQTRQFQANNFQLGDPRQQNLYQTSYQQNMKVPKQMDNSFQQTRDQIQDRGSNFVVGTTKIDYQSEANAHFGLNQGKPASLDVRTMKDLRSSHFRFNDVQNNMFKTTANQSFQQQKYEANLLDPAQEQNLKSHHFELGQQHQNLISEMHDSHRPLNGRPNALNVQLARDLRTHHFALS